MFSRARENFDPIQISILTAEKKLTLKAENIYVTTKTSFIQIRGAVNFYRF